MKAARNLDEFKANPNNFTSLQILGDKSFLKPETWKALLEAVKLSTTVTDITVNTSTIYKSLAAAEYKGNKGEYALETKGDGSGIKDTLGDAFHKEILDIVEVNHTVSAILNCGEVTDNFAALHQDKKALVMARVLHGLKIEDKEEVDQEKVTKVVANLKAQYELTSKPLVEEWKKYDKAIDVVGETFDGLLKLLTNEESDLYSDVYGNEDDGQVQVTGENNE